MRMTFDPAKNDKNLLERGLSFEAVAELDWETALVWEDVRRDYGERRMRVLAWRETRLCAVVITYRDEAIHVISFRKANKKEVSAYHERR
jgi:uncharacterized DUF497 family protein